MGSIALNTVNENVPNGHVSFVLQSVLQGIDRCVFYRL